MTLDFKKLLKNSIVKQLSVQHVEIPDRSVQIFKRDELVTCQKVTAKLQEIFGESFLADGDYWVFFSNEGTDLAFDKEFAEKTLFKVVNAGLGESANNMTEQEMKIFGFDEAQEVPEKTTDDIRVDDTAADRQNGDAVGTALGDNAGTLDESVQEPKTGEKFIFLKITMK